MGRIVVGVDGSEPSEITLDWALEECALRTATLEVVCAFSNPASWLGIGEAMGVTIRAPAAERDVASYANASLERLLAHRRTADLGFEVVGRALPGHPAEVLVERSVGADLLVVGSRSHGDIGSFLLGSVGLHCVHHAACPVVVVRGYPRGDRSGR